jgi:ribosome biogenesis GTPase
MISTYSKLGINLIMCSAKSGDGIDEIRALIEDPYVSVAALCGVSGVGKSTILNRLIPSAKTRTGEVSERTGQGRQTTSQPRGFVYPSSKDSDPLSPPKIVIDLPGVQFFGLAHLDERDVIDAFSEIKEIGLDCRFRDCAHIKERSCAVRAAVESGAIARWRYQSYLQILEEIKEAKEY